MKLDIIVPTSMAEIPLMNYQKFLKMQENSDDKEFIAQKMVEIFCGIELKDVVKEVVNDLKPKVAAIDKRLIIN